jgi:ribosomal protein S18 acetylase RimI-like enzyme
VRKSTLYLDLLAPCDWRMLRRARLMALRESPQAFTSTYAKEAKWKGREWRRFFDAATWVVARKSKWKGREWRRFFDAATCVIAREAKNVIGLARSAVEPGQPSARNIESVWVAPRHRRRGVCAKLLQALAQVELQAGVTDLKLWVLEDNHRALLAYTKLGFEPTGARQYLSKFGQFERRLRLSIGPTTCAEATGHLLGIDNSGGQADQLPGPGIHSLASTADTVGEPQPFRDLVPPGIQKAGAEPDVMLQELTSAKASTRDGLASRSASA